MPEGEGISGQSEKLKTKDKSKKTKGCSDMGCNAEDHCNIPFIFGF
jgi:hypothetical protein